jgi:hypothetical protein
MDPYDAIREQLQGARSRALGSLKERVDQALEALDQAKSSLQQALSQSEDELFPIADVEAAIDEIEAAALAAAGSAGINLEVLQRLDRPRSQSELLHELMAILTEHTGRAAVLVIRGGEVSAWSGVGFADADTLQRWQGQVSSSPQLSSMLDQAVPVRCTPGDDPLISQWIAGLELPQDALLVPISLRGKLMGAVYADCVTGSPWHPGAVQALVAIGCWLIDSLHHRTFVPTPMLAEISSPAVEPAAAAPVGAEVPVISEPEFEAEEPELEVAEPPAVREPEIAAAEPDFEVAGAPAVSEPEFEAAEPEFEVARPQFEAAEAPVVSEPEFEAEEPDFEVAEPPAVPEPDFEAAEAPVVSEPEFEAEEPDFEAVEAPAVAETHLDESAPDFDPSATLQVDLEEAVQEVAPIEPPVIEEAELETSAETAAGDEMPVEPPSPPPVRPVTPPDDMAVKPEADARPAGPQLSAEEETRHEEARRFARLLVSEIKLYNEDGVDRGRANRDLYQRLKEDIDRSREMYEKRISPDIRASRDYFHEELVRILADGDPDALGM